MPEIKAYLNGIKVLYYWTILGSSRARTTDFLRFYIFAQVPRILRFKTFFVKICGVMFAVAGGLAGGKVCIVFIYTSLYILMGKENCLLAHGYVGGASDSHGLDRCCWYFAG